MTPFQHRFTLFCSCKVSKRASRFLGKPHKIQLFTDYSIIVATLPEPTVLPPSRYLNSVFCGIFYAFYYGKQRKIVVFVWRIFICMISWHRFGTKIIFPYTTYFTWCQHHVYIFNKNSYLSSIISSCFLCSEINSYRSHLQVQHLIITN